jgi:hypothetical protein
MLTVLPMRTGGGGGGASKSTVLKAVMVSIVTVQPRGGPWADQKNASSEPVVLPRRLRRSPDWGFCAVSIVAARPGAGLLGYLPHTLELICSQVCQAGEQPDGEQDMPVGQDSEG